MPVLANIVPILIWRFDDAPLFYSQHFVENKANWLAVVPKEYGNPGFIEKGTPFGCHQDDKIIDGCLVRVGYHADAVPEPCPDAVKVCHFCLEPYETEICYACRMALKHSDGGNPQSWSENDMAAMIELLDKHGFVWYEFVERWNKISQTNTE
ncbi:MAG: hypothetical protein ACYS1A_08260 [Planctomycetota bacterium]|jgi:hypothetical protein